MPTDEHIALWTGSRDRGPENFELLRELDGCYVALSPSATPALIVPLPEASTLRGRVLGSVRLRYDDELRFDLDGRSWTQPAAVIDCLDAALVRTFSAVVRDLLERLDSPPFTAKRVADALRAWDELLRRRPKLGDASELGLWGELHIISIAPDRDAMIQAWRGPLGETMDFLGGGVALECKTSGRLHRHIVSQDQSTFGGENVEAYVASIWACEDATAGKTLDAFVDELLDAVSDSGALMQKLMAAGYQEEHRDEYERRFVCPSPPTFHRAEQVPRVHGIDQGITNIRYDVDISRVPSLNARGARGVGALTAAAATQE